MSEHEEDAFWERCDELRALRSRAVASAAHLSAEFVRSIPAQCIEHLGVYDDEEDDAEGALAWTARAQTAAAFGLLFDRKEGQPAESPRRSYILDQLQTIERLSTALVDALDRLGLISEELRGLERAVHADAWISMLAAGLPLDDDPEDLVSMAAEVEGLARRIEMSQLECAHRLGEYSRQAQKSLPADAGGAPVKAAERAVLIELSEVFAMFWGYRLATTPSVLLPEVDGQINYVAGAELFSDYDSNTQATLRRGWKDKVGKHLKPFLRSAVSWSGFEIADSMIRDFKVPLSTSSPPEYLGRAQNIVEGLVEQVAIFGAQLPRARWVYESERLIASFEWNPKN